MLNFHSLSFPARLICKAMCVVVSTVLALPPSISWAEVSQRERPHSRDHSGGIGTAVGIGVIVGGAIKQGVDEQSRVRSKQKKPPTSAGRERDRRRAKVPPAPPVVPVAKKIAPPVHRPDEPRPLVGPPGITIVAPPENCKDCAEIWERVQRYVDNIIKDEATLAELEKQLSGREAELAAHQAQLRGIVNPVDKSYLTSMVSITQDFIKARGAEIASLRTLIGRQRAFLAEQMAALERCVANFCPKQIVAGPPPVPAAPPDPPPVPVAPPDPPPVPVTSGPACFGPKDQRKLVIDYNPSGPRAPAPDGLTFYLPDASANGTGTGGLTAFTMLSFFVGSSYFNIGVGSAVGGSVAGPIGAAAGASAGNAGVADATGRFSDRPPGSPPPDKDSLILDRDTVDFVQQQLHVSRLKDGVKLDLHRNAGDALNKLACDQTGIFTNRGSNLIVADASSTTLHLALGTFSVYWEATCEIGPKKCCVPNARCASGYENTSPYVCRVKWTIYDTYNFGASTGTGGDTKLGWGNRFLKAINPVGYLGVPFRTFGYWDDVMAGHQAECMSVAPTSPPPR